MAYDKNIQDIIEYSGLKYDYIRKCLNKLETIFDAHIKRGHKNSILFDSNALTLFDRIKQLKEQGFTIEIIKDELEKELLPKSIIQSENNLNQTPAMETILKDLQEITKIALQAKDQTIQAKEETIISKDSHIKALERKILLITDSKDQEQMKEELKLKEEFLNQQSQKFMEMQNELRSKDSELETLKKVITDKKEKLSEQKTTFFKKLFKG